MGDVVETGSGDEVTRLKLGPLAESTPGRRRARSLRQATGIGHGTLESAGQR